MAAFGLVLFCGGFLEPARAYTVPGHLIAERLTKRREDLKRVVIHYRLVRPKRESSPGDMTLWRSKLVYPPLRREKDFSYNGEKWPLLPLFFAPSSDRLMTTWREFGIPVPSEEELMITPPEELKELEKPPHPFYKRDITSSIRRIAGRITWMLADIERQRKVYVEKDTFYPIAMAGLCPEAARDLSWGISSSAECLLHFHYDLRRSAYRVPSRIVFLIEGRNNLEMHIERVIPNPSDKVLAAALKEKSTDKLEDADEVVSVFVQQFLQ